MNSDELEFLEQFLAPERKTTLVRSLEQRTSSLTLVLDRIVHSHNISAIVRSADAFGLTEIHVVGGKYNQTRGISLGAEQWVSVREYESPSEAIAHLKTNDFELAVLASPQSEKTLVQQQSLVVNELPFERRVAIVLGSEGAGAHEDYFAAADYLAHIPMYGFVESFNVSVACAITLFCSICPKSPPQRRTPLLSEEERSRVYSEWVKLSVPRSEEILRDYARRKEESK